MNFNILYQDESLLVMDKPAGFHVHKPELPGVRAAPETIVMAQLRDQVGRWVYPVHRLDFSTSGCLLWAYSSEIAAQLGELWQTQAVEKEYWAVARGWPQDRFEIDLELKAPHGEHMQRAVTRGRTRARIELPEAVGKRHSVARYSWLELHIQTGRYHQIRRHLNRIAHPVLGDTTHGDGRHNQFFRNKLGIPGLCLRAVGLNFPHPVSGEKIQVVAPLDEQWQKIQALFGKT